jgi:hypothetical protein
MLTHLPESARRPTRNRLGLATSAVIHTALIAAALTTTARAVQSRPRAVLITRPIYVPVQSTPPASHSLTTSSASTHFSIPTLPTPNIPTSLPSIPTPGPGLPSLDTTWTSSPPASHGSAHPQLSGTPLTAATVDAPVAVIGSAPTPRYPSQLRDAGVTAHLTMQFIVDTTGHVEPTSIHSTSADIDPPALDAFTAEITTALLHTHYHPATVSNHPVRQLVAQEFIFAIQR